MLTGDGFSAEFNFGIQNSTYNSCTWIIRQHYLNTSVFGNTRKILF